MSEIKKMIERMCPEGVLFKPLGDFGTFESIGVDKKIVEGEKLVRLLNYVDVYKYAHIDNSIPSMIVSAPDKKIIACTCEKGDIFITPTSETRDDIGHAAVITETLENTVYSYHIMRLRLFEHNMITAFYIRYLFETKEVQNQIVKLAKGQTRFGLSKYDFAKIEIPVPPIEVQSKIVELLDSFSKLTAELSAKLTAELSARKQQYESYRDNLLSFNNINRGGQNEVKWLTLGEIGIMYKGTGIQKKDFQEDGFPCIHYGQIHTFYSTWATETISFVNPKLARSKAKPGDLVIATTSEDVEACCKATAWLGKEEVAVSGDATIFHHNQNPKYVSYLFQTEMFAEQKRLAAIGVKVTRVSPTSMLKFKFPFPSLKRQEEIVTILDKFEALTSDLTSCLPAEIKARQQQYEYYRDQLLTFKRAV